MDSKSSIFLRGISRTFSFKRVANELTSMQKFDYVMLFIMVFAQVLAYIATGTFNLVSNLSLIVGIFTIINLILVNRGRLTNYLWGTLATIFWLIMAIQSHLIGDIFSQVFYLIMQFVGIYFWQKNLEMFREEGDSEEVVPRKLSFRNGIIIVIAFVVIYGIILATSEHLNGQQIFLDATLLPLGIVAMVLMAYGYRSQWVGWILIDFVNVIIWYNNWQSPLHGGRSAFGMFVLQIIMLLNCMYGASIWLRKKPE